MLCPDCAVKVETEEAGMGDVLVCGNCGAEMQVIGVDPVKVRLLEEEK